VFPAKPAAVIVSDGKNKTNAQIIDAQPVANGVSVKVLFIANGVPPVGYKTFYLKSVGKTAPSGVAVGNNFIENKFFPRRNRSGPRHRYKNIR